MLNELTKLEAHINNIALSHTIFDLPFALMAAILAANGSPDLKTLLLIIIAVTSGRAAALAINNLADLKYDSKQPRMSYRAMVRGEITKPEAMLFIIICLLIMICTVSMLKPICLKLLPIAALPFIIYPFTKRFTGWCHLCLGVAIAMAPAGGWVAVSGEITLPMIFLCTAVAFWMCGFDAMYGAQDERFDKSQKLHSLATEYGVSGAFFIAKIIHVISIICLVMVGWLMNLNQLYYFGVGIATVTLFYQHLIVSPYDFSKMNQSYFMRNGIVSTAILICTWLSFVI